MSISVETAQEHLEDPAVLCCRREKGKVLEASDLEDPTLFPDYEDSGLLELPDNVLKIGQVLGATLDQTMDALKPLTPDVVDNIQEPAKDEPEDNEADQSASEAAPTAVTNLDTGNAAVTVTAGSSTGILHLSIKEGKGIHLDVPLVIAH